MKFNFIGRFWLSEHCFLTRINDRFVGYNFIVSIFLPAISLSPIRTYQTISIFAPDPVNHDTPDPEHLLRSRILWIIKSKIEIWFINPLAKRASHPLSPLAERLSITPVRMLKKWSGILQRPGQERWSVLTDVMCADSGIWPVKKNSLCNYLNLLRLAK